VLRVVSAFNELFDAVEAQRFADQLPARAEGLLKNHS
jgi:hypothetical protein